MLILDRKKVEVLFKYDENVLLSFTTDANEFWNKILKDDAHQIYTGYQHIKFFWEVCVFLGHTDIGFEQLQYYPEYLTIKTFVQEQ